MLLVATACAGTPSPEPARNQAPQFLSLSPESLGRSLSLSQLVTGDYGDKSYTMRFEVEITPARLAIAGLSPLGVTLFTLVQDQGGSIVVTQLKKQTPLNPRNILFDLYLTYWPSKALQAALSQLSMQLDKIAEGSVRRVRGPGGDVIAEITYPPKNLKNGEIVIQHFDFPYRLRIITLEARGTPRKRPYTKGR